MDPVQELMAELRKNPNRFRATDGYERLLAVLNEGHSVNALKTTLREGSDAAGDLLWTVAQLASVESFVPEACEHLSSPDKGTAAYAIEIVLRGGDDVASLRAAFDCLRVCDVAVCEHAVRTLAGDGLGRLREVLGTAGHTWSVALAGELGGAVSRTRIESLILDGSRDRQVVGVALAALARERDPSFSSSFSLSDQPWIRDYGSWLDQKSNPDGLM